MQMFLVVQMLSSCAVMACIDHCIGVSRLNAKKVQLMCNYAFFNDCCLSLIFRTKFCILAP